MRASAPYDPAGLRPRHRPLTVACFAPALGSGGADRVLVTLLGKLDRQRFQPVLALLRREGVGDAGLPTDVPVEVLGARRLAYALPALTAWLRRVQPDVVFSMHGAANIVVALAHRLARLDARLVLSERSALHRADHSRLRRAAELPAKWLTYRHADLITAVSTGVASDLVQTLGLRRDRVQVVENPVVDDELDARSMEPCTHPWFSPTAERPVLLAVGRLVTIKDYPTMLRALVLVRERVDARLAILGEGPLRADLEALARQLGLADHVAFLGFDANPFPYMRRATLLVHASRAEGLPSALIQAMACGLVVVSTDCDHGPREVIRRPGEDGLLVPVGDPRTLAASVIDLLEDPVRRRLMAVAARHSSARYAVARVVSVYEDAIAGSAIP